MNQQHNSIIALQHRIPSNQTQIQYKMFIFNSPLSSLSQNAKEAPQTPAYIYLKIFLCLLLKIVILLSNLIFINKKLSYQPLLYTFIALFVLLEIVVYGLNRFYFNNGSSSAGSRPGSWSGPRLQGNKNGQSGTVKQLQESAQEDGDHKDNDSSNQTKKKTKNPNKNKCILSISWHIILAINIGLPILSIGSTLQAVLSTSIFKLRCLLYPIQLISILSCIFLITTPLTPSLFVRYKSAQIGFLKYVLVFFIVGAFFDYLSFGVSNSSTNTNNIFPLTNYSQNYAISDQHINFICFYLAFGIGVVSAIVVFCKKHGVYAAFKELVNSE